jgi:hypothetical protein
MISGFRRGSVSILVGIRSCDGGDGMGGMVEIMIPVISSTVDSAFSSSRFYLFFIS